MDHIQYSATSVSDDTGARISLANILDDISSVQMSQRVETTIGMSSRRSLWQPTVKTPFELALVELEQEALEASIQSRKALTLQEEYTAWMDPLSREEKRFLTLVHRRSD
ncbi:MAG: hypothetical protein JRN68_01020 [Nitrososphaerota archaeon]|nr:hypothetical protein [Ferrimicrobium acidiphilum]MDG6933257.1 hypothetical protein [Nitrososphaerota archaeon]